jgi:hypothetical protein
MGVPLIAVVFNAGCFALENLFAAGEVWLDAKPIREAHKGIVLAVEEHVPGALHVRLLVANERVSGQYLGHPIFAQPALQGVLAKRAVLTRLLDVRQLGHGSAVSSKMLR